MTTISTQRGTAAGSGNAGTLITLFTNSGSVNATRVITNGVMAYMNPGSLSMSPYAAFGGEILVMPSGNCTGAYIVGRAMSTCSTYMGNAQFVTDTRQTSPFGTLSATGFCTSCGTTCGALGIQAQVQTGMWCVSNNPGGCGVYTYSQQAAGVPSMTALCSGCWQGFATMAPQFWIGPSDLVKFMSHCNIACGFVGQGKGGYNGSCNCTNVTYSFTTVSE